MIASRTVVTKHTSLATREMVVAEHPLGARAGAEILARGGNAVDAAVATAFAMTVVEPFMSTLGGSGTMLIHLEGKGTTTALDFSAVAPSAAHETMYRIVGGVSDALFPWSRVEGEANVFGHRAVAVPGSVAGLTHALARYGTMELADVLAPAVALARDGFVTDWYLALKTASHIEELGAFAESARTYLRHGRSVYRPPTMNPGDRVTYPDLAQSLALIARDGADAFYRGAIAEAIDAEMAAHGGLVTRADLAAYAVREVEPLRGRYRDLDLAFMPFATGGVTALEILNILEQFPSARVGWGTPDGLHVRARAVARAFLDRFEHLGDPDSVKAPWERLTAKDYARAVAAEIRRGGQTASGRRGRGTSPDCTTHVGVIDRRRNMVSLTHTAVSLWGSRVVVPGTGILLNNGMIWFDPEPGKANSVGPGKRPLVNMVPVLGFRRGAPHLTLGAPGGRKIVSAIPQVVANLADTKASPQAAIDAPRLHTEGGPVSVDDRVGEKSLAALRRRGHDVMACEESYSSMNFARPVAIRITSRGLEAGRDSVGAAAAAGR